MSGGEIASLVIGCVLMLGALMVTWGARYDESQSSARPAPPPPPAPGADEDPS